MIPEGKEFNFFNRLSLERKVIMGNTREFTIDVLNELIQTCKEEQLLFNSASKRITDPKLIQTLKNYSKEKEKDINKLESEIKRLGGKLINLKSNSNYVDNSGDIKAEYDNDRILLECVNQDVMTLNRYSSAIKEEILWEVIPLVAKQYFESQNMHEKLMHSFSIPHQAQYNVV